MKLQTLAVAAGVSAPLILGGAASAGYVGVKATMKGNPFGLLVINLYAIFDRPGEDHMIAVAGTPNAPLIFQVGGSGTFYNHPFGGDTAPSPALVAAFPSLAYDTFVTIGKKTSTGDQLTITPGFPIGISGTQLTTNSSGWAITPNNPQGNPFDAVNSFPGNGQILIGQFSTVAGLGIPGSMLIQFISNGVPEQARVFLCGGVFGPCPCSADCGDGDGIVGIVDFLALLAEWGQFGTPCDLDGGRVGITDLLWLLSAWGSCLQQPSGACCLSGDICAQRTLGSCKADGGTWQLAGTSCDDFSGMSNICTAVCPWDCGDMDGTVDVVDFLNVLDQWNLMGASCDIGLGDPAVGINDLLSLLANWGPCP